MNNANLLLCNLQMCYLYTYKILGTYQIAIKDYIIDQILCKCIAIEIALFSHVVITRCIFVVSGSTSLSEMMLFH